MTFGANRSIRFAGGDNDTKYHISLPLGALTDKNAARSPTADCRKMYMVFAPRFEIVGAGAGGRLLPDRRRGTGATRRGAWTTRRKLTGGRYFIGDADERGARRCCVAGGATRSPSQRGYESSTPGSWPAGTRMKKLSPISGFQSDVEWGVHHLQHRGHRRRAA